MSLAFNQSLINQFLQALGGVVDLGRLGPLALTVSAADSIALQIVKDRRFPSLLVAFSPSVEIGETRTLGKIVHQDRLTICAEDFPRLYRAIGSATTVNGYSVRLPAEIAATVSKADGYAVIRFDGYRPSVRAGIVTIPVEGLIIRPTYIQLQIPLAPSSIEPRIDIPKG